MKKCTGCDKLDNEPLGLNNKGNKYLACCPDNNYVEISVVEWLELELEKLWVQKYLSPITVKPLLEQAKELEKQQCLKMLPYDLDELVKGFIERTGYNDFDSYSYKLGFQKALELLTFKSE